MLTETPDYETYKPLRPDLRIFDPRQALTPIDEDFDWESLAEAPIHDYQKEIVINQKEKFEFREEDRRNE